MDATETPKAVFAYRVVTGLGAIITTALVGFSFTTISAMNNNIIDLRIYNAMYSGKMDIINSKVDQVVERVNSLTNTANNLSGRLNNSDARIGTLEGIVNRNTRANP